MTLENVRQQRTFLERLNETTMKLLLITVAVEPTQQPGADRQIQ